MHHRPHIDKHGLIVGWDCAVYKAFLNDNAVAEDQGVDLALKVTEHSVLESLFDALRLS